LNIKNELRRRGYNTPLVADIHFTPNAAEIAARIVEKVRVNPGNYVDKKKFELIEYSDADYAEELGRIRERFTPLITICKKYGTAMRIGTNHGSLSDRIMSRYGDTPMGMVESAMEFLRIARSESCHNIVLSMKASNPQVMVQAYRLLVKTMWEEFGECYPLHLGVTEAGDGEDGRIKSAVGIGTLLEDGLGDTTRVSLTEDPELEIPVCRDLIKRYSPSPAFPKGKAEASPQSPIEEQQSRVPPLEPVRLSFSPFGGMKAGRRETFSISNIGGTQPPVVIADLSKLKEISPRDLESIGYTYDEATDKWTIADTAADYVFTGHVKIDFALPGTLKVIMYPAAWLEVQTSLADGESQGEAVFPIFDNTGYVQAKYKSDVLNFVMLDCFSDGTPVNDFTYLDTLANDKTVVLCLSSENKNAIQSVRRMFIELLNRGIKNPTILVVDSNWQTADEHLIHYATEAGALLLDGMGDGVCFGMTTEAYNTFKDANTQLTGRRYSSPTGESREGAERFINNTAFSILQATRTRISKTEYISCPSCGRTLFDLQETTAKIRNVTHHLKGVKIAIMGCIVNGPGEMADADFGYVGSGPGRITLYKGKEVVKRNVASEVAVEELISLLKENGAWIEKTSPAPLTSSGLRPPSPEGEGKWKQDLIEREAGQ
ncbi:MAG: (E)-4-hydroxy-3-methylbut-2-enyl-diphosphate synthase, partial [Flavisolibacter sp.]|nr:(E)-4-hydroxy-3-methylbut-2-enyl-diphosphate synthase [Flavisolibacter sp.]